jgi:hypothetical protein
MLRWSQLTRSWVRGGQRSAAGIPRTLLPLLDKSGQSLHIHSSSPLSWHSCASTLALRCVPMAREFWRILSDSRLSSLNGKTYLRKGDLGWFWSVRRGDGVRRITQEGTGGNESGSATGSSCHVERCGRVRSTSG